MGNRKLKRVAVDGFNMAYVDEGQGRNVLFLHGTPTSSYLWRNVIPHVVPHARCIAPDLIGFGESDKPTISYGIADEARYLESFIHALGLNDVVLVLHDWGSALGFDWARRHERQVCGLAFMEFVWPFPTWLDFNPDFAPMFQSFHHPELGRKLLIEENAFIEQVLAGTVPNLSTEDLEGYRRPFLNPADREPIWRFTQEFPMAGAPADIYTMVSAYHDWLLETEKPKLLFWAKPGGLISPDKAAWYQTRLKNCHSIGVGEGIHYLQEHNPEAIGKGIAKWLTNI